MLYVYVAYCWSIVSNYAPEYVDVKTYIASLFLWIILCRNMYRVHDSNFYYLLYALHCKQSFSVQNETIDLIQNQQIEKEFNSHNDCASVLMKMPKRWKNVGTWNFALKMSY